MDGFYVVTNNTGGADWAGIFPDWARFEDNSDDPNGYMMVVNSSVEPGAFYEREVTDLCENTDYEFSADIRNLYRAGIEGDILPNVSFLIDGVEVFTTGNIPNNDLWNDYAFAFSTAPGQFTVRLTLRNNAPGGLGNDLALDNISFRPCGPEATVTAIRSEISACEDPATVALEAVVAGSAFPNPAVQWQVSPDGVDDWVDIPGANVPELTVGQLTLGGQFYRFLVAASSEILTNSKCRIISDVVNISVQVLASTRTDVICDGMQLEVGTSVYTESGTFLDTLTTDAGCDSIVTTNLTVLANAASSQSETLCEGDQIEVGTSVYTESGTYLDTLIAGNGCDSIVTTNLTVITNATFNQAQAICEGGQIEVGTSVYTESGTYQDTLVAVTGCDSIVTTNLTVIANATSSQTESICEGGEFLVGASVYTESGTYLDTLVAVTGCDSIVTTNLTVIANATSSQTESICEGGEFLVGASVYIESGTYLDTLVAVTGCDSIVTTNLTVIANATSSQTESICEGGEFLVGASVYTESGTYQDTLVAVTGCDSIVTTNLTVIANATSSQTESICEGGEFLVGTSAYTESGTYLDTLVAVTGCDSIVTTNLTVIENATSSQTESICEGGEFLVGTSVYTESGTYLDTLVAVTGCDSIVTTNLTVIENATSSQTESICEGGQIEVGTSVYTESGTYLDTLVAVTGCDSIVTTNLTVIENATSSQTESICEGGQIEVGTSVYTESGTYLDTLVAVTGCDSIVTTNLTVIENATSSQTESICEGGEFLVGTSVYTESGTYLDTLVAVTGCDSIVTTNLTVIANATSSQTESICEGGEFLVGASVYTESGTYLDTLVAVTGCDSIVTTNLTVIANATSSQTESICEGGEFLVGASVYTESGTYLDTLVAVTGCDSIVTTNLTVIANATSSQTESICEGGEFLVGTSVYTESGTYLDTLVAVTGCDSIVTTNLTVIANATSSQTESICEGGEFLVGTSVYTESGTYLDTLVAVTGCDSIVTTNLTVIANATSSQTESICEGGQIEVGTSVYTESGTYLDTLVAVTGCDSIVTTNLTVIENATSSQTESICEGGEFLVGTSVYTESGTYLDTLVAVTGCDSIVTTNLTVIENATSSQTESICEGGEFLVGTSVYTESGMYLDTLVAVTGCDSIVTTNLTVIENATSSQTESICEGGEFLVGASVYTESGTYLDTLTAITGCDSIVTTELMVLTSLTTNQTEAICEGGQVEVGTSIYTESGTYIDTLVSSIGCDSIVTTELMVLTSLTTNQTESICEGGQVEVGTSVYTESGTYLDTLVSSTGCDSIVTTDLTVLTNLTFDQTEMICEGEQLLVGSSIYTESGTFLDTLVASSGCDSIITTELMVLTSLTTNQTEAICEGGQVEVGTSVYTESGTESVDTLVSSIGCDSIVTTELMVLTSLTTNQTESICEGGQVEVGTSIYTESGTYVDTLVSSTGCDSIVTTELMVLTSLTTNQTEAICEGGQVEVGTSVYTESGTYLDTLVSSTGCDSIVTTELMVLTSLTTNQTESICEGGQVEVGTSVYTESGTYLDTLVSSTGCDSIITTELTVLTSLATNQTEAICEGGQVEVGTSVYTESGTYVDTLVSSTGCDSIITTELTVLTSLTTNQTEAICEGGQVEVGTSVYTESGTYLDTLVSSIGCDSIVTTELMVLTSLTTNQTESICEGGQVEVGTSIYTESGTYVDTLVSSTGCDSIVTTELMVLTSLATNQTEAICEGSQVEVGTSIYTESGTYLDTLVSSTGCDSIITTELMVLTSLTTNKTESICEGGQVEVGTSIYTESGTYLDTLVSSYRLRQHHNDRINGANQPDDQPNGSNLRRRPGRSRHLDLHRKRHLRGYPGIEYWL